MDTLSEEMDMEDTGPTEQMSLFEVPEVKPKAGAVGEENGTASHPVDDQENDTRECYFCRTGINLDDDTVYREIIAWVRNANKDSATLRMYTGNVSCGDCISKLRRGMDSGQPTIDEALSMPSQSSPADDARLLEATKAYRLGQADSKAGRTAVPPSDAGDAEQYDAGYDSMSDRNFMSDMERIHGGPPLRDETFGGRVKEFYPDGHQEEYKKGE